MTLIIVLYALFASSFTIGKVLLNYSEPIFLTGARMFLGGLILLTYQYFWAHKHFYFKRKHAYLLIQLILFGIYLTYILRFWALQDMTSSKTAFLYNLSPFMAAGYSYFLFHEKMTKQQWVGLAVGFAGMIPILISSSPSEAEAGEIFFVSLPELAVLVSVACHSYSWVLMRKLVRFKGYSPVMVNGMTMAIGGFLALITSLVVEGTHPVSQPLTFLGWLLCVIIISNIICFNLYGFLLKKYTATFMSFAGFLGPLFTALYGWGLLGEKITWHFFASAIIVFLGLFIFYRDELKKQKLDVNMNS